MLHSGRAYLCSARALRVLGEAEFKSNELTPLMTAQSSGCGVSAPAPFSQICSEIVSGKQCGKIWKMCSLASKSTLMLWTSEHGQQGCSCSNQRREQDTRHSVWRPHPPKALVGECASTPEVFLFLKGTVGVLCWKRTACVLSWFSPTDAPLRPWQKGTALPTRCWMFRHGGLGSYQAYSKAFKASLVARQCE